MEVTQLIQKLNTYHVPYMKSYTQCKIHKNYGDWHLEFVNQNVYETSLEYICVEKQQEDNDGCKQYTHVLDAVINLCKIWHICPTDFLLKIYHDKAWRWIKKCYDKVFNIVVSLEILKCKPSALLIDISPYYL